jgi:biopolymer transport protein ExbD
VAGAPEHFGQTFGWTTDEELGAQTISGINVTPLVDITLVLLIIFMVTATVIVNAGIKVDLPKAASGSDQAKTTLALTMTMDGALYLNGEKSSDEAVAAFIARSLAATPDLQAVIAADRVVPHGQVVHVIDLVKRAGVRRFAISVAPGGGDGRRGSPAAGAAPAAATGQ